MSKENEKGVINILSIWTVEHSTTVCVTPVILRFIFHREAMKGSYNAQEITF